MSRITGTTNAQSRFLRALRVSNTGPTAQDWPAPAVLQRWMRRPAFAHAMKSIQKVLGFAADFQLQSAATAAAQSLHGAITSGQVESQLKLMKTLGELLKLSHLRQRFASEQRQRRARQKRFELPSPIHPDVSPQEARELLDQMGKSDHDEPEPESVEPEDQCDFPPA